MFYLLLCCLNFAVLFCLWKEKSQPKRSNSTPSSIKRRTWLHVLKWHNKVMSSGTKTTQTTAQQIPKSWNSMSQNLCFTQVGLPIYYLFVIIVKRRVVFFCSLHIGLNLSRDVYLFSWLKITLLKNKWTTVVFGISISAVKLLLARGRYLKSRITLGTWVIEETEEIPLFLSVANSS